MTLTWVLAELPLVAALSRLDYRGWQLGVLAVLSLVALQLAARLAERHLLRSAAAVTGASAGVLVLVVGPRSTLIAVGAGICWSLVVGSLQLPNLPAARTFRPLLAPLIPSLALLILGVGVRVPALLVMLAAALAVFLAIRPGPAAAAGRFGDKVGQPTSVALAAVAMTPAVVVITIMWVAYRVTRFDPLGLAVKRVGWEERIDSSNHPERPYSDARGPLVTPAGRRRRALAGGSVVLVALVTVAAVVTLPPAAPESAAFDHDGEWAEVWTDQYAFNASPRFDATTVWRIDDFESEHVNQRDGRRVSWRAPECDCRRMTVWWFGGSAAWGFFQRDRDTIPSQLAQLAWDEGVALDVENFALPGFSAAQGVQLLGQLSVSEPLPDLVVFYDGANELFLQSFRNNRGRGSDESPASYAETQLDAFMRATTWPQRLWSWRSGGRAIREPAHEGNLGPSAVAGHAVERYVRQMRLAEGIAEQAGVPILFVWQPTMSAAPASAVDEWDPMAPPDAQWHRELVSAARDRLPPGVLDLSDRFDDLDRPVFPDFAHTNEVGSMVVAESLLGPVLGGTGEVREPAEVAES